MNKVLKYVLIAAAIYFAAKLAGFFWSAVILFAICIFIVYNRRAVIMTRMAMRAYFGGGDVKKGEQWFEKAYKTGEMTPECKIAYSSFCLRENKFERGKKLLNNVINSRYSSAEDKLGAKHNLAVLIWREGDLDGAIELMEQVHKQMPTTATYGTLGVLYLERAKKSDAQAALEFMLEAYDYNCDDKTIADNLGELYLILGENEKAKEVYAKLMEKELQTPVPYYNYGRVLKALRDNDGAKQRFEEALTKRFTSVMTVTREAVQAELDSLSV